MEVRDHLEQPDSVPEPKSEFAKLLQDYMWSRRPPLNPHKLAVKLGIGRQTVYNWLNAGTIPQPSMLPLIAEKTGIPLTKLFEAAGYAFPGQLEEALNRELDRADMHINTPFGEVFITFKQLSLATPQELEEFMRLLEDYIKRAYGAKRIEFTFGGGGKAHEAETP